MSKSTLTSVLSRDALTKSGERLTVSQTPGAAGGTVQSGSVPGVLPVYTPPRAMRLAGCELVAGSLTPAENDAV